MELELQKEGQDQKLIRPTQSALYEPNVALEFFKTGGKAESFEQGKTIHVEEGGHTGIMPEPSRMYLLLEGEVALSVRKKPIATIGKGEIFGEMATISQLPHSATAVAHTDCKVISLDEAQFQAAAAKAPQFALMLMNIIIARLLETVATLTKGGALSDKDRWNRAAVFDTRVLADLRRQFEDKAPVSHPAKKVIMKEGDKGMFAYLVLEGAVAISIEGKIVEKVGPGGIFGELALVNQKPRVATATADTECSLLQINRNELMELVKTKPGFTMSLLRALAHRLRFMISKYK
ncbi:MAG TPA: cyclic nucleotide-binding domain-containing protein [Burkholderiales bacterium]|nr:cyclic nucleotide-binding domain-containing protein [Burkholderiales bacterium]